MNITGMHVEGIPFPGIKVTGSNVARTIVTTKLTRGTISTRIHVATLEAGITSTWTSKNDGNGADGVWGKEW